MCNTMMTDVEKSPRPTCTYANDSQQKTAVQSEGLYKLISAAPECGAPTDS